MHYLVKCARRDTGAPYALPVHGAATAAEAEAWAGAGGHIVIPGQAIASDDPAASPLAALAASRLIRRPVDTIAWGVALGIFSMLLVSGLGAAAAAILMLALRSRP